jgi:addiction module HigA family antidote
MTQTAIENLAGFGSNSLENEHPGQALREDYLEPLGMTAYKLAKGTGLSQIHISEILRGQRSITPMTSLLLGNFFGISPRFWLNMQNHYDLLEAQRANPERLKQAVHYADLKAA